MRTVHSLLALAVLFTVGCYALNEPEPGITPVLPGVPDTTSNDVVSDIGTIVYQDLEGGFYGLLADDGTKYYPFNLDDTFRQEHLRVRFRARRRTDVMSIVMWGEIVEIIEMQRLDRQKKEE